MSELRKALEAIIRITNVIPSTYRTEAIAEIANTAEAALSNEEAGEAALAGGWGPGISDGLILACGECGQHTDFDYTVSDRFWRRVVPDRLRLGVVCLSCLDRLATAQNEEVSSALERVQFTGLNRTILLVPTQAYLTTPIPTVNGTDEPPNASWLVQPILAGVIPSDAGRTAVAAPDWADAQARAIVNRVRWYWEDSGEYRLPTEVAYEHVAEILRKVALREAAGRVELVERED